MVLLLCSPGELVVHSSLPWLLPLLSSAPEVDGSILSEPQLYSFLSAFIALFFLRPVILLSFSTFNTLILHCRHDLNFFIRF